MFINTTYILILSIGFLLCPAPTKASTSFSQKVLYTDKPDMGEKWQFGIRVNDLIIWDFHWNIADWVLVDFFTAGFSGLEVEKGEEVRDVFRLLTLKSPAYQKKFTSGKYSMAGGLKLYSAEFNFTTEEEVEGFSNKDNSGVLFITQNFIRGSQSINLFTSLSGRERSLSDGKTTNINTIYFVPGYQNQISQHWILGFEYYLTNAEKFPLKIFQFLLDEDQMEFYNPTRDWYSFMIWGFSYARKHLRLDLYLSNHISFSGPIIPLIGLGWDF